MRTVSVEPSSRFRWPSGLILLAVMLSVITGEDRVVAALSTAPAAAEPAVDPAGGTVSIDVTAAERDRVVRLAAEALAAEPVTITKYHARYSPGGSNDFYSNGDYWWPNPQAADGLPYVKRDGETNPNNFNDHRRCLGQLRDNVAALAAAYKITGNNRYTVIAAEWLRTFFINPATRMNPDLKYGQAIPGVSGGRGIGIIDTLPLIEVAKATETMQSSPQFPPEIAAGVKKWFADYLNWMVASTNGQDIAEMSDDHAVMYWLQVAVYAQYVGDEDQVAACHNRFKYYFLASQMAEDGSFPKEFSRTKSSYEYSICQLDNMATLCQVLSDADDDLWHFVFPDRGGIRRAVDFMYPYLEDKTKWPKSREGNWPVRQSNLLFAGLAFNDPRYLDLWKKLDPDPADEEVRRNTAVTQPVLWIK